MKLNILVITVFATLWLDTTDAGAALPNSKELAAGERYSSTLTPFGNKVCDGNTNSKGNCITVIHQEGCSNNTNMECCQQSLIDADQIFCESVWNIELFLKNVATLLKVLDYICGESGQTSQCIGPGKACVIDITKLDLLENMVTCVLSGGTNVPVRVPVAVGSDQNRDEKDDLLKKCYDQNQKIDQSVHCCEVSSKGDNNSYYQCQNNTCSASGNATNQGCCNAGCIKNTNEPKPTTTTTNAPYRKV